jgi:hypothetical protein
MQQVRALLVLLLVVPLGASATSRPSRPGAAGVLKRRARAARFPVGGDSRPHALAAPARARSLRTPCS